jgi:hypothetical protein
MEDVEINVYPNINRIIKISKAKFRIIDLKLNESVRVVVYLYTDNDLFVQATQFVFDGEDYKNWSNDDTYLVKLVKQKITDTIK